MKIEHVAMYVNDLEGARNFFETYFGAVSNSGYHNQKTDFRPWKPLKKHWRGPGLSIWHFAPAAERRRTA